MSSRRWIAGFLALGMLSCASGKRAAESPRKPVVISVVGTNDLHGKVERVAVLSGYVKNLRAVRARDGGGVIVLDAGDMFQGTLESNLGEGAAVVEAYNAVGYTAATIGNHEFDFGPAGEAATATSEGEDPRGALKARAAQARFPFLAANIIDEKTGKPIDWPNVHPDMMVEVAGVKVGIIGVSTESTPRTTIAANFLGLRMAPLHEVIIARAQALRNAGAVLVVVGAHAGGKCHENTKPEDISSCKADEEVFEVARKIPNGLVDVIVAGHTHATIAHFVNGMPVIESWASGRGFGRVDVTVDPAQRKVVDARVLSPKELCQDKDAPVAACEPGAYEELTVEVDAPILAAAEPHLARARELSARKIGVTLSSPLKRAYADESTLGNLVADMMRASRPGSDVAITNGGGLRADLPSGELTYGALYQVLPFDNRFASVHVTAGELKTALGANLQAKGGILSVSGLRVKATCTDGKLAVVLTKLDGTAIPDDTKLTVATSDFLASGGDGVFGVLNLRDEAVQVDDGPPFREGVVKALSAAGNALKVPDDKRMDYPGRRPVTCAP